MVDGFCPKCGASIKPTNKFCKKCGGALVPAPAEPSPQATPMEKKENGRNRKILLISVSTIALALLITGAAFFGFRIWTTKQNKSKETAGNTASTTKQESQTSEETKSKEVLEIETFIKDHYAKLDNKDITGAYDDFTDKKKQEISLVEYSESNKNHQSSEIEELRVESSNLPEGKVWIKITIVENVSGQYVSSTFEGYLYLKKINGQWKNDEYDLSEVI